MLERVMVKLWGDERKEERKEEAMKVKCQMSQREMSQVSVFWPSSARVKSAW